MSPCVLPSRELLIFPSFLPEVRVNTVNIHAEEMLHLQFLFVMQTDASAGLLLAANHTQP